MFVVTRAKNQRMDREKRDYLMEFRVAFNSRKVWQDKTFLVYMTIPALRDRDMETSREIIERLKLPLEVCSNEIGGFFKESFLVKLKNERKL